DVVRAYADRTVRYDLSQGSFGNKSHEKLMEIYEATESLLRYYLSGREEAERLRLADFTELVSRGAKERAVRITQEQFGNLAASIRGDLEEAMVKGIKSSMAEEQHSDLIDAYRSITAHLDRYDEVHDEHERGTQDTKKRYANLVEEERKRLEAGIEKIRQGAVIPGLGRRVRATDVKELPSQSGRTNYAIRKMNEKIEKLRERAETKIADYHSKRDTEISRREQNLDKAVWNWALDHSQLIHLAREKYQSAKSLR
ncbi:hypothetical protein J4220_01350, partial [Candidatus Micrarchaeota archaeon]|nr:hypothetical protein [Candidatus Micrarchaeota archaeon]